jgi:hypothetical protein
MTMSETTADHARAMADARQDAWDTPDLGRFLSLLPDEDIDHIATLLARMPSRFTSLGRVLPSAMDRDGLRGKALISAILQDLAHLGSHTTGPTWTYRTILQRVAWRHGVDDDGKQPCSAIERAIQRNYMQSLRPDVSSFRDAGKTETFRKFAFAVPGFGNAAYLLSPHWQVVTAALLEIAALRRIGMMRIFADSLEA